MHVPRLSGGVDKGHMYISTRTALPLHPMLSAGVN